MTLQSNALRDLVVNALEDRKAHDIRVLDVRHLTDITDYMIVATGRSTRQVKSIAEHVGMQAKSAGCTYLGSEGADVGDWVLIDLCDVVVHVMIPESREFYQLEKLWTDTDDRLSSEFAS